MKKRISTPPLTSLTKFLRFSVYAKRSWQSDLDGLGRCKIGYCRYLSSTSITNYWYHATLRYIKSKRSLDNINRTQCLAFFTQQTSICFCSTGADGNFFARRCVSYIHILENWQRIDSLQFPFVLTVNKNLKYKQSECTKSQFSIEVGPGR